MAGGVAGVVTWAFATPMDVMKARLQMSGAGGRVYQGVLHCMSVSLKEEGVRVFFKGLLLNSLRAFPVNAITFLSYESLMRFLTRPSADWPQDYMHLLDTLRSDQMMERIATLDGQTIMWNELVYTVYLSMLYSIVSPKLEFHTLCYPQCGHSDRAHDAVLVGHSAVIS